MASKEKPDPEPPPIPSVEAALRLALEACHDPKLAPFTDAIAGALLATIGSGPSLVALQTLTAAGQASSQMFVDSVRSQQQTNILGMVATANCVQSLLGQVPSVPYPHPHDPYDPEA